MVRTRGVEPPRLAALDPKSSVSASSTTSAKEVFLKVKIRKGGTPVRIRT